MSFVPIENPAIRVMIAGFALAPPPTPPPPPKPVFELDGKDPTTDAFKSVLNEKSALVTNAPPAHQGALGYVSQGLNAVLGALRLPEEMLDMATAMGTNELAAALPELPAATLVTGLHFGLHAHTHPPSLVPPSPPIPLPSVGTLLMSGAVNVHINGLPAARVGDVGIAITCGSLSPPFEVLLGSSKVFIGGSRAARMGDITMHDNPMPSAGVGKLAALQELLGKANEVVAAAGIAAGGLGVATQYMDAKHSEAESKKAAERAKLMSAIEADMAQIAASSDNPELAALAAQRAGEAAATASSAAAEAEALAAAAEGQELGAAWSAAQLVADQAAMALRKMIGKDPGVGFGLGNLMLGSPNVRIGGFPCPNLMTALKGLLKAALGLPRRPLPSKDKKGKTSPKSCPS